LNFFLENTAHHLSVLLL